MDRNNDFKAIYRRIVGEESEWTAEKIIQETFRRVAKQWKSRESESKEKETKLQRFKEEQSRKGLRNWKVGKRHRYPSVSMAAIRLPELPSRPHPKLRSRASLLSVQEYGPW